MLPETCGSHYADLFRADFTIARPHGDCICNSINSPRGQNGDNGDNESRKNILLFLTTYLPRDQ